MPIIRDMQEELVEKLSSKKRGARIKAYKKLLEKEPLQEVKYLENQNFNYHIRTGYSCAEVSPSLAVYKARKLGLPIIALADYATFKSAKELQKTAEPSQIAFYSGAEVNVAAEIDDKKSIKALIVGVPRKELKGLDDELSEYRALRRNYIKKTADKINVIFKPYGIRISAKEKSYYGGIKAPTDMRGLFSALSEEIIKKFGNENAIITFLTEKLKISLSEEDYKKLEDLSNQLYGEDLAYILSTELVIKGEAEKCKPAKHLVALANACGAIPVAVFDGEQKKLDEFIQKVQSIGFRSVMIEHRDSDELAAALYEKCVGAGLLPLCRTLIDYKRKKFDSTFESEELASLYNDCAYAVVGHEICTSTSVGDGLFSRERIKDLPDVEDRIKLYSRIAFKGDL